MTEEIVYRRIYWQPGQPKGARFQAEVSDPPCSGAQGALCLPEGKRVKIFCPYTLKLYTVSDQSQEWAASDPMDLTPEVSQRLVEIMQRRWSLSEKLSLDANLPVAAVFIKALGGEPPQAEFSAAVPQEDSKPAKGGKPMADSLLKPVKRESKVGQTLAFFLETPSISKACEKFNTTRSNILSRLFILNKDHGIGYILNGDSVVLQLPVNADRVFA